MLYRHVKTGVQLEIDAEVNDKGWVLVKESNSVSSVKAETPKRKTTAKKKG